MTLHFNVKIAGPRLFFRKLILIWPLLGGWWFKSHHGQLERSGADLKERRQLVIEWFHWSIYLWRLDDEKKAAELRGGGQHPGFGPFFCEKYRKVDFFLWVLDPVGTCSNLFHVLVAFSKFPIFLTWRFTDSGEVILEIQNWRFPNLPTKNVGNYTPEN